MSKITYKTATQEASLLFAEIAKDIIDLEKRSLRQYQVHVCLRLGPKGLGANLKHLRNRILRTSIKEMVKHISKKHKTICGTTNGLKVYEEIMDAGHVAFPPNGIPMRIATAMGYTRLDVLYGVIDPL